jgi:hypothetical protein
MNARYYMPEIGRFISPDPIVPDPANPQTFNRYEYGLNNPIKYTDPTGHCIDGISTWVCVAAGAAIALKVIDWGWTIYDVHQSGKTLMDPTASATDRMIAELNIALSLGLELIEPDDALPVSIPADDVIRKGAISAARQALREGNDAALENLPGWMRHMVRGLVTEEKVLAAIGRQGQKRLIEGIVDGRIVKTIPDFVDDSAKIVGDIKDVAELGWERQIRAQFDWASRHGYKYQLITRRTTVLRGELARLVRAEIIQIRYIDEVLP